jgi:DNA/RNA endonuclease YhcR with UshA esterase domain
VVLVALCVGQALGAPVPISWVTEDVNGDGRPDHRGQGAEIVGIVTAPDSLFDIRYTDIYVQDTSAGVDVFSFTLQNADLGDSVDVTGTVDWYKGKTELSGATVTLITKGRQVPEPKTLTCAQMNTEAHEGELVRLVGITTSALVLAGDATYDLTDTTGTTQLRVDAQTAIPGFICIPDTFTLVGIKSQYASDTTQPLTGYQLQPRYRSDFSRSATDLPLRTIKEIQQPGSDGVTPVLVDSTVRVRGRVTGPAYVFTSGNSKSLYVQDETQGVNVYGCEYPAEQAARLDSVGDEWELVGKVAEYNGLTELSYGAMWIFDSLAVPVVPQLLPFNVGLTEAMESNLLTVEGTIVQEPVRSGSGYNMVIKNGTPAIAVRIGDPSGIPVQWMTKGREIRVTGIGGQYCSSPPYTTGYQILPRFLSDIIDTTGAFPPVARLVLDSVAPNPFCPALGQAATVFVNSPSSGFRMTVEVYDMEGRLVRTLLDNGPGGYHDLKWDGTDELSRPKSAGIYLVSVRGAGSDGKSQTVTRPVVLAIKLN